MDTERDVLSVLDGPDALGTIQSQVKSVLAYNSNRGHSAHDSRTAIMGVHHHQIGSDLVPGNKVDQDAIMQRLANIDIPHITFVFGCRRIHRNLKLLAVHNIPDPQQ